MVNTGIFLILFLLWAKLALIAHLAVSASSYVGFFLQNQKIYFFQIDMITEIRVFSFPNAFYVIIFFFWF